jgi:hypothetical protein
MEATELRIGNLVKFEGGTHRIASIASDKTIRLKDSNGNEHGCYGIRRLEGIAIDEEILLKLGGHRSHHGYIQIKHSYFNICWDNVGFDIAFSGGNIGHQVSHIKHAHQLQNLYFALTGTEL